MLIWTVQAIAATILGLLAILPTIGVYRYAVIGILVGLLATVVVAFELEGDNAGGSPRIVTLVLTLLGGVAAGVLWPTAISTGVLWLIVADRDAGGPPATA